MAEVMGGDSCSEGREFESQHHHIDLLFILFVSKRLKINEKEAGYGSLKMAETNN